MAPTVTKTKKRPAGAQGGPKVKKIILEKSDRPQPAVKSQDKNKRRSRPVTAPAADEDEDADEEAWEDEEDAAGAEEDVIEDVAADGEDEAPARPAKDPNANRDSHKAQKELLTQRRANKAHSTLLTDAKRQWALARRIDIPAPERRKDVAALMSVIRGHVREVVLKHDASRIVQTVVKYGTPAERDEIAAELKGKYKELAQNRYSKFLVSKLIRLCPTHRASILSEFQGSLVRLLLHREASGVLADAFELYANAYERSLLLRDFYGKEAQMFSVTTGTEEDKERGKRGLQGLLDGADPERRRRLMGAIKESLLNIFNNSDKGAITHAIVHRVLWEYLAAVNDLPDEAEQERLRREVFDTCQDVLAELVHTRDGSRAVREFLVQGTAKDRKHIVKALKPHVERMCLSDEAQLVLFTALDVIDDTKLSGKSLASEIAAKAATLVGTAQGRRALLYPIAGRARRHFTVAQINALAETDATRARTSKKDSAVRADEIRKSASEGLLDWVARDGATVSRDTGGSLVVADVLLYADGDKTAAINALLAPVAASYPSAEASAPHPIDLAHTSRLYKTLLQGGHFSHASKAIERSPYFDASAFAHAWVQTVGRDVTQAVACGDGAFVVAELCARLVADGPADSRTAVRGWFADKDARKRLAEWEGRGKEVLREKVDALLSTAD